MAKISRKSQGSISKIEMYILANGRDNIIIAFKMSRIEFKLEHTRLRNKSKPF